MKETDPRFANLRKKVGLFFLMAIIGIVTTIVFIGIERDIFIKKYRIHFTVDKGTGFFEGTPVKLSGFKIGKIESLALDENAKVKITLAINRKYQKWIRKDSRAMLMKEGLIGEGIIDVTVGTISEPIIEDGSVIKFEKTKGLDEIAEDVRPVLVEIRDIIHYINDPKGDIKQTLGNLKTLSSELHATKENVDKLLKNTDKNISSVELNVAKTLNNIDKTIAGIDGKLTPVMDKLNKTMDNAEKATSSLKDAVDKAAPKVPALLNKGEDTLSGTEDVVKSLKQMWPIRLFIEEPKDSLIEGDSYE